jgi:hypothetical protein
VESTVIRPAPSPPPDDHDAASKRPLSPSDDNPENHPVENGQDSKRRRMSTDKDRGRRMFGALMGTLTSFQKQTSRTSKLGKQVEKRAEIDARVKERVEKEGEAIKAEKELESKERKEREEKQRIEFQNEAV